MNADPQLGMAQTVQNCTVPVRYNYPIFPYLLGQNTLFGRHSKKQKDTGTCIYLGPVPTTPLTLSNLSRNCFTAEQPLPDCLSIFLHRDLLMEQVPNLPLSCVKKLKLFKSNPKPKGIFWSIGARFYVNLQIKPVMWIRMECNANPEVFDTFLTHFLRFCYLLDPSDPDLP